MSGSGWVVPSTEVRVVHSKATGADHQICVALPYHYDDEPDRRWPVIYVLDGNLYFGLVTDMVRAMNIRVEFCNELPDAFIVGVGYPVEGSLSRILHEVMHRRMHDFLPEPNPGAEEFIAESFPVERPAQAGGAAEFWRFLHEELVPLIESEYRADADDRTLMGHSWGATFAFYTLFRDPRVFQRYVIASSDADAEEEAAYAREHDDLPVRLHVVLEQGDTQLESVQQLVATLGGRGYPGLELSHQIIDCTHCAIVAPAFQAGLVAVFP